jgi:arginase
MRIGLIGVPYNSAGTMDGLAHAPAALRAAGLVTALQTAGEVRDLGDVPLSPPTAERDPASGIIAPAHLLSMVLGVHACVQQALREDRLALVIGGDCPVLLGCLAAATERYGRMGLLFVDGHEDAWPPARSPTGEAADMELGLALGVTTVPTLPTLAATLPLVQASDVVVLGPRDAAELRAAAVPTLADRVAFVADTALRAGDLTALTRAAVRQVQARAGPWWLHVDLDVLSTEALPAIDYPQPDGLSWDHLAAVTLAALSTARPVGWNVTIYNPDLDPTGQGAARIVAYLGASLALVATANEGGGAA